MLEKNYLRAQLARIHHTRLGCSWLSTFARGQYVCLVCGTYAYCPGCWHAPLPPGTPIHRCYLHREERMQ